MDYFEKALIYTALAIICSKLECSIVLQGLLYIYGIENLVRGTVAEIRIYKSHRKGK